MTLPASMFGVVLTGHGGPEMLQYRTDLPTPQPGPGDVVVRVAAAAVNNTDINTRLAWHSKSGEDAADAGWTDEPLTLPRIQGADVCGHIVALGVGVSQSRVGQRVLIEPCLRFANARELPSP